MDGYQTCKRAQGRRRRRRTSRSSSSRRRRRQSDIEKGKSYGVAEYLTKPFDPTRSARRGRASSSATPDRDHRPARASWSSAALRAACRSRGSSSSTSPRADRVRATQAAGARRLGDERRAGRIRVARAQPARLPPRRSSSTLPSSDLVETVEVAGPGFPQLPSVAAVAARCRPPGGGSRWTGFGRSDDRSGRSDQCRVRLGEPDRPDQRRQRPARRRRATRSPTSSKRPVTMSPRVSTSTTPDGRYELFGESIAARYLQALGRRAEVPEEGYQGEYLTDIAKEIVEGARRRATSTSPTEERTERFGEIGTRSGCSTDSSDSWHGSAPASTLVLGAQPSTSAERSAKRSRASRRGPRRGARRSAVVLVLELRRRQGRVAGQVERRAHLPRRRRRLPPSTSSSAGSST